jgi:hypothetical protein
MIWHPPNHGSKQRSTDPAGAYRKRNMKTHKYPLEVNGPISHLTVSSDSTDNLLVNCIWQDKEVQFRFDFFLGYENRDELFDHDNGKGLEFDKIGDTKWNYPIGWVVFEDFKDRLSAHEQIGCHDFTKLWYFISLSNCATVYSNVEPTVTFEKNQFIFARTAIANLAGDTIVVDIELPTFYSKFDELAFFAILRNLSITEPRGNGRKIEVALKRTNNIEYLHSIFGFIVRYGLDIKTVYELETDENRGFIRDPNKYWSVLLKA